MPWIIGLHPPMLATCPAAACGDLVQEPFEATVFVPSESFDNRWKPPNHIWSRRLIRRFERGPFDLIPPSPGQRAGWSPQSAAALRQDDLVDTFVSYLHEEKPVAIESIAFDGEEAQHFSKDLREEVAKAKAEGRAVHRPDKLVRREEINRHDSTRDQAGLDQLLRAWDEASPNAASGLPDRHSVWASALQRALPGVDEIVGGCALCAGGRHPACLQEVWLDATGALELERFFAELIEESAAKRSPRVKALGGRLPGALASFGKSHRAPHAEHYFNGLKRFFHLMPATESESAHGLMGTLLFNAAPRHNTIPEDMAGRWLKMLDPVVSRIEALREGLIAAVGDDTAEATIDMLLTLAALHRHLKVAAKAQQSLPVFFAA